MQVYDEMRVFGCDRTAAQHNLVYLGSNSPPANHSLSPIRLSNFTTGGYASSITLQPSAALLRRLVHIAFIPFLL
ncbi:hypothetical protein E2C01_081703 [Portunus trituberculatus]|uniref:Uncharacterized protein n=1 Tax=Portunus trituberculatus TaxID=210409 RepID=A0A5B7IYU4_PORTR|nr:hypothetical protein [Portunus trituberculatus]